jgi:hypothetical protein
MNPRGILISPGPGKSFFDVLFLTADNKCLVKRGKKGAILDFSHHSFYRCPPRFWDIIANCIGTWTYCTSIWCVYGFAVHWRSFWR